jgi:UPF0716 protein FxsA
MNPWVILAVVAYPVTEWFAASWLAGLIGWGGVFLVFGILMILGIAIMRRAGFAAARSVRPVTVDGVAVTPGMTQQRAGEVGRQVGDAGTLFVAGLLVAIPGLVTSAMGLALLLPPVRRAVRTFTARSVRRRAEAAGVVFTARTTTVRGSTVPGDVVREESAPGARGEIVSGEVIPGEVVPDDDPRG